MTMTQITASDLSARNPGPVIYVECFGKRLFARTSSVNGMCRIQITDIDTLAKMDVGAVIEVSWEDVATAMNAGCPISLVCREREVV